MRKTTNGHQSHDKQCCEGMITFLKNNRNVQSSNHLFRHLADVFLSTMSNLKRCNIHTCLSIMTVIVRTVMDMMLTVMVMVMMQTSVILYPSVSVLVSDHLFSIQRWAKMLYSYLVCILNEN